MSKHIIENMFEIELAHIVIVNIVNIFGIKTVNSILFLLEHIKIDINDTSVI